MALVVPAVPVLVLVLVTAEVCQPVLPPIKMRWAIGRVAQDLIHPNFHQVQVMPTVVLGQTSDTLHQTTAGDSSDLTLKAWVQVLQVLEWVQIVVKVEHQITEDNLLVVLLLIHREINQ